MALRQVIWSVENKAIEKYPSSDTQHPTPLTYQKINNLKHSKGYTVSIYDIPVDRSCSVELKLTSTRLSTHTLFQNRKRKSFFSLRNESR